MIEGLRESRSLEHLMRNENGRIVETAVEARAGFLDKPTLTVLIVSTGLIIGCFVLVYAGSFSP